MTDAAFDYTGFYTIVLTENQRDQYNILTNILRDCWLRHITNVIVLVSIDTQRRTAIYTYFPYTQFHCEAVAPVILNYFLANNTFLYHETFFPPKTNNMHGCKLAVATYNLVPFMFLTKLENSTIYTDGIDGIVFRVLSQRLNFTPTIIVPPNNQMRGEIWPNGTMTGSMKLVGTYFWGFLTHNINEYKRVICIL